MKKLAGKVAIITGAASGIGRAVALALAREGAEVGLIDRDSDGLAGVVDVIGDGARAAAANVGDETGLANAIAALAAPDILVGVAGIELFERGDGPVHELSLEGWQQTLAVNLTGMFLTMKHGIRAMLAHGRGGSVILTGSPCGQYGICAGEHAYSASKAGVHGLVRPMAVEYARYGIRVNCVIPGFVATPLTQAFTTDPAKMSEACAPIPLRRPGRPQEVASLYAWLASDEASYVTGAFFTADGGHTAV